MPNNVVLCQYHDIYTKIMPSHFSTLKNTEFLGFRIKNASLATYAHFHFHARIVKVAMCHFTTIGPISVIYQNWPESLFQTPTPLLCQNFWILVRQFFKFENPTPVQTPATIIHPAVIHPYFCLRNDHTDSCCCRHWKVTPAPGPVFPKFLTPGPIRKKSAESFQSWLRHSGSSPPL